eukprot:Lankesteria_metandrocarpae@DN5742_c0_g1_i1.p1
MVVLTRPRKWHGKDVSYLVIIDHATRFLVAVECATNSSDTVKVLKERWCAIMETPTAILTDRGAAFKDKFQRFVVQELMAYHVCTSAYYPQGNAINEAAHKALEISLETTLWTGVELFGQVLESAVAVHNACPHYAHGASPFFALFGFEPTLPGWQKYWDQHDGILRNQWQFEHRQQQLLRQQLANTIRGIGKTTNIKVGGWIVYYLSAAELRAEHYGEGMLKYTPHWSLPAKVIEVKDTTTVVQDWGQPNERRQLPLAHVRSLEGPVPLSLQQLALQMLEYKTPHALRPNLLLSAHPETLPTWKSFLDDADKTISAKKRATATS